MIKKTALLEEGGVARVERSGMRRGGFGRGGYLL